MAERGQPDRFEPLPSVAGMPGWIWRRTGPVVKILLAAALLAGVALAVVLSASISATKRDQAEAERRARAEARERLARELRAEQRPRYRRSTAVAPPGAAAQRRLVARAELTVEVAAAVEVDARRRVRRGALDGPIRRVECEPFPRTVAGIGAEADLRRRRGRYSCIAVTAEFGSTEESVGGVLGHRYRALVDFETGRYAFCKISGQAGPSREQVATTPAACGGRS